MLVSKILLTIAVVSAAWGVVDMILIAVALDKRGIPVNMLLFRVLFFKYAEQYKRITREETGKVGPLFYSYIIAMNTALVCAVIGLLLKGR